MAEVKDVKNIKNEDKDQDEDKLNQDLAIENTTDQEKEPSGLFKAISQIFFLFLLSSLMLTGVATMFALDFLDIWQFRYNIPKQWRETWPLTKYYDFVQLYQLPDEERYQELMYREKERYDKEITQGSQELQLRAKELESSYRTLVRMQKEKYSNSMEELRKKQEDFLKEKNDFEAKNKDLAVRKEAIDALSKQLASEAMSLESSLIRFMEGENRLKQVQEIATAMDPKGLATIFDELTDNQMIYDVLRGIPPEQAGKVLSVMDPEKAGKIIKLGKTPITLPKPGPSRSYIPPSLQNLVASTQAILR